MIDTATQALSLALFDGATRIAHAYELAGRGHAEKLVPLIASLPDGGRAQAIAVDVGPGSFTGVRIGIAAARALAFAWNARLDGFSALSLVAAAARERHPDLALIPVAMTGGHGELFWQRFDGATLNPMEEVTSRPIALLAAEVEDAVIFGTGGPALIAARGHGQAVEMTPDAGDYRLLPDLLACLPPSPLYGRGPDARPMARAGAA